MSAVALFTEGMADDETLLGDVRKYLERGGYVLEMEVARTISTEWRQSGVEQSYRYTDPVTGTEREGDIYARLFIGGRLAELAHDLELLIECKRTESPWIAFVGNGDPWGAGFRAEGTPATGCDLCRYLASGFSPHTDARATAYAIVEKRNSDKRSRDHAYEAVQQAASALVATFPKTASFSGEHSPLEVAFGHALVVTTSPLVTCRLDHTGALQLRSVTSVKVHVPRSDGDEHPSNSALRGTGVDVIVIQDAAFQRTLRRLLQDAPASDGSASGPS